MTLHAEEVKGENKSLLHTPRESEREGNRERKGGIGDDYSINLK